MLDVEFGIEFLECSVVKLLAIISDNDMEKSKSVWYMMDFQKKSLTLLSVMCAKVLLSSIW